MITDDTIISQELGRPSMYDPRWSGFFWVREFTWFGLVVVLRQFHGARDANAATGKTRTVSLLTYWRFLWRLRREATVRGLPKARAL